MKHLRRAFTSHRLIRTQPEGVDASAPQPARSEPPAPAPDPLHWTRRKPSFSRAEELDEHSHITLWDENSNNYEKEV